MCAFSCGGTRHALKSNTHLQSFACTGGDDAAILPLSVRPFGCRTCGGRRPRIGRTIGELCGWHRGYEARDSYRLPAGAAGGFGKSRTHRKVPLKIQPHSKIFSREDIQKQVAEWRRAGERIILGNGCFDLLHVGHIRYLRAAKQLGGRLIVAINSDESACKLKGEGRPLMPEDERAEIVGALADVDAVVLFPETDVRALIREIRPDIQVKGTDYTAENVPERDTVVECGGRVEIVGDPKQHSSSKLIAEAESGRKSTRH